MKILKHLLIGVFFVMTVSSCSSDSFNALLGLVADELEKRGAGNTDDAILGRIDTSGSSTAFSGCADSTTIVTSPINAHNAVPAGYSVGCSFGQQSTVYDTEFFTEVAAQRKFWKGISANIYIYEDGTNGNALAFPSTKDILYGKTLFNDVVSQYGTEYKIPMSSALAHEWGHQAEFQTSRPRSPGAPDFELEADALSGFYLHYAKGLSGQQINTALGFTGMFGDPPETITQSPHGSSAQRQKAFSIGIAYVNLINKKTLPQPTTWAELTRNMSIYVDCLALGKLSSEVTDSSGNPQLC